MSSGFSPELEQFVQAEIASGHFADRAAVIEHALRLFQTGSRGGDRRHQGRIG